MSPRARPVFLVLLLVLGVQAWLVFGDGILGSNKLATIALGLALLPLIPIVRRALIRGANVLRYPTARARAVAAVAISVVSAGYLFFTASHQGRTFLPRSHDEFIYLLQARMLAAGRLWMEPHALGDFFDTFYVLVEPVYAPLIWPGTSLLLLPGVAMGWPHWVVPLIASAAAVGLLYSVVTQLVDGFAGAIAAIALVSLRLFRMESIQSQAQIPILLWGLLLAWLWLRWRRSPHLVNATLLGIVSGWAAITRPLDAICLAVPLAIAVLLRLPHLTARVRVTSLCAMIAGAAPFLLLQLIFNWGVTGSVMKTPYGLYVERDQPLLVLGFPKYDPTLPLKTKVEQKRVMYRDWGLPAAAQHSIRNVPSQLIEDEIPLTLRVTLPHPLLMILLPAGLLHGFSRGRYIVWGVLPLFALVYACYTLFLPHYPLLVAPAVILLLVLGLRALEATWRGSSTGVSLAVVALCIAALPEFKRRQIDHPVDSPTMDFSLKNLPTLVQRPAVVLFRFQDGFNLNAHEEPVYNIDTASPDDAEIIRAHDLGAEKNRELIEYYGRRQPERHIYRVDRTDLSCIHMGTAGELWRANPDDSPRSTRSSRRINPAKN